jgi:serine/threonine protein kinase/Flp pilus assembly protein TadD
MTELKDQLQRTLGDSYSLERELGGGGMSRVFVAEETSLGRKVVVKVLPPDLAAAVNLERFRREIQLAAKLQHPHIVPVLAAGVSDGLPYYTMPFIEGESLRARISRGGELPVTEAVKILRDVLSALAYAHDHGVVHRDIKPDNILLTGGHAVVADFGVAKAISASTNPGASLTSLGVALGTPAYMSPEQASADPTTDHRSDLYSVGAVAYEMLSGQQLFSSRSPQAMLAAHALEEPEPLEKRRKAVPPALSALVMHALEKHAADRPQSAAEMLAQLDAAITPSAATTPYTGTMPARKVVSPPRSTLMAIGAAVVLLILGSSSWYWYSHRIPGVAGGSAAAADTIPSLAVLPFENLGKADDAYFADGMTEEISSRLGTLSGLRVIGRQSVRGYANSNKPLAAIGKELGVTYVLTGSVRWDRSAPGHSRVRVSPALLRVNDGTQVWSTPYEDELTGVFKMQSKVAEEVAQALQIQLNRGEQQALAAKPTENVEAYDYFLRGSAASAAGRNGGGFLRAVALFQHAVDLDPKFAEAWAALGTAHLDVYWFRADPSEQRLTAAKKAVDRTVELAPNAPFTHHALGNYYYHGKLDYESALREFATAIKLNPNDAIAKVLKARVERRQGKWNDALDDYRHAVSLDPRNLDFLADLSETLLDTRNYSEAEAVARETIVIAPERVIGYLGAASVRLGASGDVKGALAVLHDATSRVPADELAQGLVGYPWPVYLDKDLTRMVKESATPENEGDRINYFAGRLMMAVYEKDAASRSALADSVIAVGGRSTRGSFSEADVHAALALAYAAKSDRPRAIAEGERAVQMLPLSRDALRGFQSLTGLANAAVLAGDADVAVATLRQVLAIPSGISVAVLRADPWFDPIRSDPRFQQLLAGR